MTSWKEPGDAEMCLQVNKSLLEVDIEVPLKFSAYVLDEIGKIIDSPLSVFHGIQIAAVSYCDLSEDG